MMQAPWLLILFVPNGMRAKPTPALIVAEPRGRYVARAPIVVDCSVIAAILFDEPDRDTALGALTGKDLFAPELLASEFASVAAEKSQFHSEAVVRRALSDFSDLELTRHRVDVTAQWRLALDWNITAYDAAYLWLAIELRAPLATFDRRLGKAAQRLMGAGQSSL
jgi:predicted nucleic acid-binding protein